MKKSAFILLAFCAAGVVQAQGSGIKPGLWEARTTKMLVDGKDSIPQMNAAAEQMRQAMATMPPEQRKRLEGLLAQRSSDGLVNRLCISPAMAASDQAMLPRAARGSCEPGKFSRSGNTRTFEVACTQGTTRSVSKGESVLAGDVIRTSMESVNTSADGQRHTVNVETQMSFIGADCGAVKPLEELINDAQAATQGARVPAKK